MYFGCLYTTIKYKILSFLRLENSTHPLVSSLLNVLASLRVLTVTQLKRQSVHMSLIFKSQHNTRELP